MCESDGRLVLTWPCSPLSTARHAIPLPFLARIMLAHGFLTGLLSQRLVADCLPAPLEQPDEAIMKKIPSLGARLFACVFIPLTVAIMLGGPPGARAGLQM